MVKGTFILQFRSHLKNFTQPFDDLRTAKTWSGIQRAMKEEIKTAKLRGSSGNFRVVVLREDFELL